MATKRTIDLTETEEKVLQLLEDGVSLDLIETEHGFAQPSQVVQRAMSKLDEDDLLKFYPTVYMQTKQTAGLSLEDDVLKELQESGVPKKMLQNVRRRLEARRGGHVVEVKALTDRDLITVLKQKAALVLSYVDDFAMSGAPLKDAMATADLLIKNAQLLEGRPTAITSVEDRRKANELIPLLLQEAKRRGIVIDGTAEVIDDR